MKLPKCKNCGGRMDRVVAIMVLNAGKRLNEINDVYSCYVH